MTGLHVTGIQLYSAPLLPLFLLLLLLKPPSPLLSLPLPLLSFILSVFSLWFPEPRWILGEPSRLPPPPPPPPPPPSPLFPLLASSPPPSSSAPFPGRAFGSDWEFPQRDLSVTRGDPEMITPDEPWMCGNLTAMPYSREEPGSQAGWASRSVLHLRFHCCTKLAAELGITLGERCVHSARHGTQWNGSQCSLHYWWDTLWCQPRRKEPSKMTVSSMAHDHLCKQYRGVINRHPVLPAPCAHSHTILLACQLKPVHLNVSVNGFGTSCLVDDLPL